LNCPACQAPSKPGLKFCVECGAPLALACPACGAQHAPGQKFCGECGAPLAGQAARAPAAPISDAAPLREPEPGSAELRFVSVLFVDLVGFTSLSESRDAEDVRELLGRYFDVARTIIARYGGAIEKFIGDAVMAVWGTPIAREDDAERAVRAGLELVDAVAALGEEAGLPGLLARAGVVTGRAASMNQPGEGIVVGDRVNAASRVQSTAQPGTVYVDDVTRDVTLAAIGYEDAGEHAVKGKAEPLRLWRAVRVVAGVGGAQREEGLEAPLVARDSELRLVKELFHAGIDRREARLVVVSGAAGVGKTRLRWELDKYVDGLAVQHLWHTGRCLSYGEGVAYWALVEMVSQRLDIAENASQEETARKLAEGLERFVLDPAEREFVAPRLGALLGIAEPGLGREELFAGWRLFFERLSDIDPVVMIFEDAQWADEGLLDFVEHLLDWSASRPIFMLMLARPELTERREGWPAGRRGATLLTLEPLSEAGMGELLDGIATLPSEAREQIVSAAEGIPLYAIEIVRALADRGVLAERDGTLALTGELGELDVPASLNSLLAARLDALAPRERDLIKAMAVFGGSFARATAAALGDVPEEELDGMLSGLVRKQVLAIRSDPLSPDRGQYAFAQTLLRSVAYDMLSKRERKPRHVAAAEHLRATFPDGGEDVAELIAAHYLDAYRSGPDDDDADEVRAAALAALRRAAQRASTVGAPDTAERTYRSALELARDDAERADLTAAAGRMALQSGRHEPAIELMTAAADMHAAAGRDRDAALLARHVGYALRRLGRVGEGVDRMKPALAALGPQRLDADVGGLSAELGMSLISEGNPDEARTHLERALLVAEAFELHDLLCEAMARQAVLLQTMGRPVEARVLLEEAVAVAEEHSLTEQLSLSTVNLTDFRINRDLPGARESGEASLLAARRLGDRARESLGACNLMLVHLFAGRWDELERLGEELLAAGGDQRPDAELIHERLGTLAAWRGDAAATRRYLALLAAWEDSDDLESKGAFLALSGHLAVLDGRFEDALRLASPLVGATVRRIEEGPRLAWPILLEAALALGRLDEVAALTELIEEEPPGLVSPYLRAQHRRGLGLLAAARADHDAVEAHLTDAIERFRALDYPYWLARAQADLVAWLEARGRTEDALALREEAGATFARLGVLPARTGLGPEQPVVRASAPSGEPASPR
jgi:class 3 adenylate cyclase/tetratricopeptide (TPR) repeat protein